jgi:poly(3-hydroxybutyrate) depolymerase
MSSEANSGDKQSGFRLRALLLLVWLAASGLASSSQKPTTRTLEFGGHKRAYQLLIPAQAAAGPVPLIVLLHGRGGNGQRPMAAW